jgi:hypothetical protein
LLFAQRTPSVRSTNLLVDNAKLGARLAVATDQTAQSRRFTSLEAALTFAAKSQRLMSHRVGGVSAAIKVLCTTTPHVAG